MPWATYKSHHSHPPPHPTWDSVGLPRGTVIDEKLECAADIVSDASTQLAVDKWWECSALKAELQPTEGLSCNEAGVMWQRLLS